MPFKFLQPCAKRDLILFCFFKNSTLHLFLYYPGFDTIRTVEKYLYGGI